MEIKIACPGYEISTEWYEGTTTAKIVIVLPGYSSSKKRQKAHAEALVQGTGVSVLAVDFSGHGTSPFALRDTRPGQHLLELICVFDYLTQKYPRSDITVSGSSYGGFLAAHLPQYRAFSKLILRAPAIYKPEAFYDPWSIRIDDTASYDKALRAYRQDGAALAHHPILQRANLFKGKTLVVVHEQDEIVPATTTDAYAAAFNADVLLAEGFAHAIDKNPVTSTELQDYQDKIVNWLRTA